LAAEIIFAIKETVIYKEITRKRALRRIIGLIFAAVIFLLFFKGFAEATPPSNDKIQGYLKKVGTSDSSQILGAIDDIVKKKDLNGIPALVELSRNSNKTVSEKAKKSIELMKEKFSAKELISALSCDDKSIRGFVSSAVKKQPESKLKPLLRKSLSDPDPNIRKSIPLIMYNSKFSDSETIKALEKALKDTEKDVKKNAMRAMHHLAGPESIDAVIEAVANETDYTVKKEAHHYFTKVAKGGNKKANESLLRECEDDNPYMRKAAATYFAWKWYEPAKQGISKLAEDPFHLTREKALKAVAKHFNSDEAVSILRKAMNDEEYSVRRRAARLLLKKGNIFGAVKILENLTKEGKEVNRDWRFFFSQVTGIGKGKEVKDVEKDPAVWIKWLKNWKK